MDNDAIKTAASLASAIWDERQLELPEASWRGKTVGIDTATREVFLGESSADIPKGPTVILVQVSILDAERRRLRLGGRWRRVY